MLQQTLSSLASVGFTSPTLFVDGIALDWIPPAGYADILLRHPAGGQFVNWCSALQQLYLMHLKADYYAIFEDDLICCNNLLEYLEREPTLNPNAKAYWNLLTHDVNYLLCGGANGWFKSNQMGKGAVALVFNRKTVKQLLSSPILSKLDSKLPSADGSVITALKPLGYTEYVHCPSLVQHVGEISTMNHNYGRVKAWPSDNWNPLDLSSPATPSYPTGTV